MAWSRHLSKASEDQHEYYNTPELCQAKTKLSGEEKTAAPDKVEGKQQETEKQDDKVTFRNFILVTSGHIYARSTNSIYLLNIIWRQNSRLYNRVVY